MSRHRKKPSQNETIFIQVNNKAKIIIYTAVARDTEREYRKQKTVYHII